MNELELAWVLASHKKWLNGDIDGSRADLSGANLCRANLSYADLSGADLSHADISGADLSRANLSYADLSDTDLSDTDLSRANLHGADLSRANLSGANLDFSCLPLYCGSLTAQFDDKQIIQIIYHAVKAGLNSSNVSIEVKTELMKLVDLANKFHRANECGKINKEKKKRGSKIDKETTEI